MSHQAVTAVFNLPITDHRKLLALVALAHHHNAKTGLCIPGQETLAGEARCTTRTLRGYLNEFEKAGYIARKRRYDGKGCRTSDAYTMRFLETLPEAIASGRPEPVMTSKTLPENLESLAEN